MSRGYVREDQESTVSHSLYYHAQSVLFKGGRLFRFRPRKAKSADAVLNWLLDANAGGVAAAYY